MALELEHVRRSFGSAVAVRDVSFRVERGTTFGLLGPNGAGKTTTMRLVLGILEPDGGSIRWNGTALSPATRRRFGYLPEERGLYGSMRVRDQIVYFARLHGLSAVAASDAADRWILQMRLHGVVSHRCSELSKGNQQKVQIACAAVHDPELLILDEPFSGLDPLNAEHVRNQLEDLRDGGTTLVLSSHQMWQLEDLCDRFCIIASGETRATGTLAELGAGLPTRTIVVGPSLEDIYRRAIGAELRGQ